MSKTPLVALSCAAIVLIAFGVYVVKRNSFLSEGFDAVAPGASREQVLSLMGRPDVESSHCQGAGSWLGKPGTEKECASEYRYDAVILPQYYTVGFDGGGRAVAKYAHVSP